MPLHFQAHGLYLSIHVSPAVEDWLTCDIELRVPGFSGAYSANLQIGDLY